MRRYLTVTLANLAFFAASGCASISTRTDTIIERSSEVRPAWVDGDFAAESEGGETFVTASRSGLFRLELGIKQVQAGALERGCALITERVSLEISQRAQKLLGALGKTEVESEIARSVAGLATTYTCPELTPRQVYWENIRLETADGPRTHYDIFLLLTLRNAEFETALQQAANILNSSNSDKARLLGQDILKNFTN